MEFVAAIEQDMHHPCRGADGRPAYDFSPHQDMRGWRAEKRKPMVSCLAARGRLSARQLRRFPESGPAFRLGHRAQIGRRPVAQKPKSSASSWQGLLVVPGGAPMPPEYLTCVAKPAGAAPRPASRRLMNAPLRGRGDAECKRGLARGDKHHIVIPAQAGIQDNQHGTCDSGYRLSPV